MSAPAENTTREGNARDRFWLASVGASAPSAQAREALERMLESWTFSRRTRHLFTGKTRRFMRGMYPVFGQNEICTERDESRADPC